MQDFETYEDVAEWLEPMGLAAFWEATQAIGLYGPEDQAHVARALDLGDVDMQTALPVIKRMALLQLTEQWDLPFRVEMDVTAPFELAVID